MAMARLSQQSYYRWRKENGGLELDQAALSQFGWNLI
jgi:hypothetical protein